MVEIGAVTNLLFAASALAVAVVVFVAAPGRLPNRFFAGWLALRGMVSAVVPLAAEAGPAAAHAWLALGKWMAIMAAFLLVSLVAVYLRPVSTPKIRFLTPVGLLVATAVTAWPALAPAEELFVALMQVSQAAAAVFMAAAVLRRPGARDTDWLLAIAFVAVGIMDGLLAPAQLIAAGNAGSWLAPFIVLLASGLAALAAGGMLVWATVKHAVLRSRRAGAIAVPSASLMAVLAPLVAPADIPTVELGLLLAGAIRMFVPMAAAYGLIRYRLFAPAKRLRRGVNGTVVAGVFVGVYFVVSEGTAAWVGDSTGSTAIGIAVALVLMVAIMPIERAVRRVTDGIAPEHPNGHDSLASRQRAYQEQLELAWLDGRLEVKERMMLDRARRHLRLSAMDVDDVETPFMARLAQATYG